MSDDPDMSGVPVVSDDPDCAGCLLGCAPMTVLVRTRAELAAALRPLRRRHLVPTMGALHAGHAALIDAAGPHAVVSVFVNPLQFGEAADLARYPRTLAADLDLCASHDVAVLWAPSVDDVYGAGAPSVTVSAGPLGAAYEGASRPGHFDGMLTVVAKLFGVVRPDAAWFGQKDAQQLALVRRMVTDLDLGVAVHEVPTVRDPDGLALSSRNVYLSAEQRRAAPSVHRALESIVSAIRAGETDPDRALRAGVGLLEAPLAWEYLALVDPVHFAPSESVRPAIVIAAARADALRLLDNELVPDLAGVVPILTPPRITIGTGRLA